MMGAFVRIAVGCGAGVFLTFGCCASGDSKVGGSKLITDLAGKDGTSVFEASHGENVLNSIRGECCIGEVATDVKVSKMQTMNSNYDAMRSGAMEGVTVMCVSPLTPVPFNRKGTGGDCSSFALCRWMQALSWKSIA